VHARPVACPTLIGRDRELETLHAARRGLARSHPAFVIVGGEAGIGKSRLVAQFLQATGDSRRTRTTISVECLENAPQPFGPVRDAIESLARLTKVPLPPILARLVARDTTSEAIEKADLFAAATTFLREIARDRATILTVEDLHWSDATTLEFLGHLASRIERTRLLIVATYRSDEAEGNAELSAAIARAMREPTTIRLDLRALKGAQVRELLHGALDGHVRLERDVLENIVARSEGNPFFGEELLKSALEHSGNEVGASLPMSIRASIIERLRAFSSDERLTIDRAAVLGLRFDPEVLGRIMGTSVEAILPALRRARDANIIVEEDGERVRFRFRHALTRQAIYDNLLLFDARRTHRTILETLEAFGAQNDYIEELAYHAWEARDVAKAHRYNELAGERAFALFALPEARVCFERAREMSSNLEEEASLLERLSRVTSMLGNLEKAIELYDSAIAGYVELENFGRAAIVVAWSAADRNNGGDTGSVAFGAAFLERHWGRIPVAPRDQLIAMIARLAIISYDVETAAKLLSRIEAPDALTIPARQNVLLTRSELAEISGDPRGWAEAASQLVDLLPNLAAFTQLASGYPVALAASYYMRDDLVDRAFAQIDRTEAHAEFDVLRAYGHGVRAHDAFARGRLDRARDALRLAIDMPELFVSETVFAGVAPFVADALDDDSLVPSRLDALFADTRRTARHGDDVTVLAGSACWLLRRNQRREAIADLRLGLRCLTRPLASSRALLDLAARHFDVAELSSLARFVDVEIHGDEPVGSTNARALAAIVAQRTGDEGRAVELAIEAAQSYRAFGRPLLEAAALETARRFDDARAMYARYGAVGHVKRLDELSGKKNDTQDVLSEREREVAEFVAAGLGNSAIAERLFISKKTVEKHVGSIYDKLGVRSRAQLAGLLARAVEPTSELRA
jgi:DNA-binding CsgD family transcriptional regulator